MYLKWFVVQAGCYQFACCSCTLLTTTRTSRRPQVLLMCAAPRKEYYKKFLLEPLPVESHLDAALHDAFVAEVVARTIENKQVGADPLYLLL